MIDACLYYLTRIGSIKIYINLDDYFRGYAENEKPKKWASDTW